MKRVLVFSSVMLASAALHASTVTTQLLNIRSNATGSGGTRISVLTTGATSCSTQGWYSFEFVDGVGKVWVASLLAAQASGRSVTIHGNGTCDPSGLENISYIDALP